jgi:hypothetical protein
VTPESTGCEKKEAWDKRARPPPRRATMYLAAAARLARPRAPALHRTIATTVSPPSAPAAYSASGSATVTPVSISNVEASWTKLSPDEKASVHQQLEAVQQKDWKELSIDEKKAGEYLYFFSATGALDRRKPGVGVLLFCLFIVCSLYSFFLSPTDYALPNRSPARAINSRTRRTRTSLLCRFRTTWTTSSHRHASG